MKCSGSTYYTDYMERESIKAVQKEEMIQNTSWKQESLKKENGRARAAQSQR